MPDAELAHQREVFLEPVVMVARHVQRVSIVHFARNARETVPDRLALALLEGGSLNLGGGRGRTPDKAGGKRSRG
jgi:hypothetical protein